MFSYIISSPGWFTFNMNVIKNDMLSTYVIRATNLNRGDNLHMVAISNKQRLLKTEFID